MGLAALAPFAPAIGAGFQGLFGWLGSRGQAKATRRAAEIQADAARETGEWQARSAEDQLAFLSEQAARDLLEQRRVEEANWILEREAERRRHGERGDEAFNLFGLTRHQRRLGFEETAADRANARAELLAGLRTGHGRYSATQRRVGRLGALMGAPQPAGGREIAPLIEPTALVQPQWVPLADPRQTAFGYPDYRPAPDDPALREAARWGSSRRASPSLTVTTPPPGREPDLFET